MHKVHRKIIRNQATAMKKAAKRISLPQDATYNYGYTNASDDYVASVRVNSFLFRHLKSKVTAMTDGKAASLLRQIDRIKEKPSNKFIWRDGNLFSVKVLMAHIIFFNHCDLSEFKYALIDNETAMAKLKEMGIE